ncbi:hypothetical protein LN050_06705 [Comamonadaceae bacterium M7527]|nr:hypothetical protein LN050_06705 [Comamonadaceae bacterium M7527]
MAADFSQDQQRLQSLNTIGTVSYVLHLIVAVGALVPGGQWGPLLLLVALVMDMYKRPHARGTWHESHFSWRLRSVLWAGFAYLVTLPLWLLLIGPGWLAWLVISVWFLIRIVRGFINLNAGKPMETVLDA